MSRVTSILDRARRVLSDKDKTRWSDADLLETLNEGLESFILQTETLKLRSYIAIENNISLYDISTYAMSIKRVSYLNKVLEPKTYKEMDTISPLWDDNTGTEPKYVIFNNLKSSTFKIYPKVPSGMANIVTANSAYGALIDVEVIDDLFQIPTAEEIEVDIAKYLLVYYIGKPNTVTIDTLDVTMQIDSKYDTALVAYITAQHLLFDQDTLSRELGLNQASIFTGYVAEAKVNESTSNNTFASYITTYRRF